MRTVKHDIEAHGLGIPYSDNTNVLAAPLNFYGKSVPNRIAIIAPFGGDAKTTGEFSIYSHRRYARFAGEGAAFIFTEPVAPSESMKRHNGQLCLNERTLRNFKDEIEFIKNLSVRDNNILPNVILKLDLSGYNSDKSVLPFVCCLAEKVGFDGIETGIECNINNTMLADVRSMVSNNFIFVTGLNDYEVRNDNIRKIYEQKKIFEKFIITVNLNCDKKQLDRLNNNISVVSSLQKQNPDIIVLTYGYSGIGSEGGNIAAGLVKEGVCAMCGFSKQAVAYPSFARDLITGRLDKTKCCTMCRKCEQLQSAGLMSGCVVFDSETYLPCYNKLLIK